jgi:hypothetical protein
MWTRTLGLSGKDASVTLRPGQFNRKQYVVFESLLLV